MALSAADPVGESLSAEASTSNRDVPIFMAHGTYDPIIPLDRAERSRGLLQSLGYRVEWREYPGPHSACPAGPAEIRARVGKGLRSQALRAAPPPPVSPSLSRQRTRP